MNEERFFARQESDETDEKPERNRFESIIDFLRRNGEVDAENEDDEKSKKRKKGKSSRWQKFMRRMFGGEPTEDDENGLTKKRTVPLILFEPIKSNKEPANDEKSEKALHQRNGNITEKDVLVTSPEGSDTESQNSNPETNHEQHSDSQSSGGGPSTLEKSQTAPQINPETITSDKRLES